jgi:hypothetical protein
VDSHLAAGVGGRRPPGHARALAGMLLGALALMGALAANPAQAATLAITPPASPVAESSGFAIGFSGNAGDFPSAKAYLFAEIAPAAGVACAPTPSANVGSSVSGADGQSVVGVFGTTGSAVLETATTYQVCAWLTESSIPCCGERIDPPVTGTVTVRGPILAITTSAAAQVAAGTPFEVTVNYQAEVPRRLTVLVTRASSCSISSAALKGISTSLVEVVDGQVVSGAATIRGAARFDQPGTYLVCGFFEKDGGGAAQYAYQGASVVVSAPRARLRGCGYVGGPKRISGVSARNVACGTAKSIARIWGRRRQAPRKVGVFRCSAASGRARCRASGDRLVSFRYRARRRF